MRRPSASPPLGEGLPWNERSFHQHLSTGWVRHAAPHGAMLRVLSCGSGAPRGAGCFVRSGCAAGGPRKEPRRRVAGTLKWISASGAHPWLPRAGGSGPLSVVAASPVGEVGPHSWSSRARLVKWASGRGRCEPGKGSSVHGRRKRGWRSGAYAMTAHENSCQACPGTCAMTAHGASWQECPGVQAMTAPWRLVAGECQGATPCQPMRPRGWRARGLAPPGHLHRCQEGETTPRPGGQG